MDFWGPRAGFQFGQRETPTLIVVFVGLLVLSGLVQSGTQVVVGQMEVRISSDSLLEERLDDFRLIQFQIEDSEVVELQRVFGVFFDGGGKALPGQGVPAGFEVYGAQVAPCCCQRLVEFNGGFEVILGTFQVADFEVGDTQVVPYSSVVAVEVKGAAGCGRLGWGWRQLGPWPGCSVPKPGRSCGGASRGLLDPAKPPVELHSFELDVFPPLRVRLGQIRLRELGADPSHPMSPRLKFRRPAELQPWTHWVGRRTFHTGAARCWLAWLVPFCRMLACLLCGIIVLLWGISENFARFDLGEFTAASRQRCSGFWPVWTFGSSIIAPFRVLQIRQRSWRFLLESEPFWDMGFLWSTPIDRDQACGHSTYICFPGVSQFLLQRGAAAFAAAGFRKNITPFVSLMQCARDCKDSWHWARSRSRKGRSESSGGS